MEHCLNCGGALKIIAAIEDPPVIDRILSHLGLPTRARRHAQLVELIYSRQSEQPKNRLPTQADGAARSEFDRPARSPAPRAPAVSAPPPTLPSKPPTRPQLLLNSAAFDRLGALKIYLRS